MPKVHGLAILAAVGIGACSTSQRAPAIEQRAPAVTAAPFGKVDDIPVELYTLTNKNGLVAKITNFGATVVELHVPDRTGALADIVLGFDNVDAYAAGGPYFGAIVGRVANRIGNARFTLDGKEYPLVANDKPHHLHGGRKGWDKVVWGATLSNGADGSSLALTYVSKDGEEGYPGTVSAKTIYTLTNDNELKVEMQATTDTTTLVNMAHHSYWNLGGHNSGTILDHVMTLSADQYTPGTPMVPDGTVMAVKGTPFDFTSPKAIGHDLKQIGNTPTGYDHNFVINGKAGELRLAARMYDPASGRVMEIHTTQPGIQFYDGNLLDASITGKGGKVYVKHYGFCLETQHFPDAPNQPNFPSTVLRPGEEYQEVTVHRFSTRTS